MIYLIILAVLALVLVWLICRQWARDVPERRPECGREIDAQLKRRHDLIPNLVSTVKLPWSSSRHARKGDFAKARAPPYAGSEGRCREHVTQARETLCRDGELSGAQEQPETRLTPEELTSTENRISFRAPAL